MNETKSDNTTLGLDPFQYSASIRFLRTTSSWGIHVALIVLGVLALPAVAIFFFLGAALMLPFMLFFLGIRFCATFFGFRFQFPRLWSRLFGRRKQQRASEAALTLDDVTE